MLRRAEKLYNKIGRTFWTTSTGFLKSRKDEPNDELVKVSQGEGLLISSLCEDGSHAPILDLNFAAQLMPSTTIGHSHLFLNKKISKDKLMAFIKAAYEADLIDQSWYEECLRREQAIVLAPGREKNRVTDKSGRST